MTREQSKKIEQLYTAMFSRLYGVALAALRDESFAEEAVQDTFRIACSKPEAVISSPNPEGWLMNTLKHVLMKIRSQRAKDNAYILPMLKEHESISETAQSRSCEILSLIKEEDRQVLVLMVLKGMTLLETSKQLGISLEACKKRSQRARKRLKKAIIQIEEKE